LTLERKALELSETFFESFTAYRVDSAEFRQTFRVRQLLGQSCSPSGLPMWDNGAAQH
jgi:hypothetical protein